MEGKNPPALQHWQREVLSWAKAQHTLLLHEEARGLRKFPLFLSWDVIIETFSTLTKDDTLPLLNGTPKPTVSTFSH